VIIDCARYVDGVRVGGPLDVAQAGAAVCLDPPEDGFVWLGLFEPTAEELAEVRAAFALTPHDIEDLLTPCTRPNLEHTDDGFLARTRTILFRPPDDLDFGTINVLGRPRFVIAARYGESSEINTLRKRLEGRPEFLKLGPGAVLHGILDHVVDDWSPVLHELDGLVDDVERLVFSDSPAEDDPTERIYNLKRDVLEMHRAALPLVEPLDQLAHGEVGLINPALEHRFRDQHERLLRVLEQVQDLRELLTHLLEANLTQVSIRQNEDMRKISAWAAMIAVPTLIAGIYGMNFQHMPELGWKTGYPISLGIMAVTVTWLYLFFRRRKWL
jgi:magnesium transporter